MKKKKLVLWYPSLHNREMMKGKAVWYEPLALGIIAALTPDDWEVVIRDGRVDEIKYEECDLVGVTAMTRQALSAYEIAKIFREKGVKVIMGGIHATMRPEEALRYVDAVVKGEAELLWGLALEDFNKGRLKKIYETDETHDLKNLPKPRRDLFNTTYTALVQTTRGCPFDCEFCSVTAFNGPKYRKRPVNEVLDELENVEGDFVFFADDNMLGFSKNDRERFIRLCEGIIQRNIKKSWVTQVSVNFADEDRIMKIAAKAGCAIVLIGIESASPEVLAGNMNKKANLEFIKNHTYIQRIHKNGIATSSYFILGNDEDNKDCFKNTYKFIKKLKLSYAAGVSLIPWPGTKVWDRLEAEGRLTQTNFPEDWGNQNIVRFKLKNMSDRELVEGLWWLNKKLLSVPRILWNSLRSAYYTRSIKMFLFVFSASLSNRADAFAALSYSRMEILKKEAGDSR